MKNKNYIIIDNELYHPIDCEVTSVNSDGTYDIKNTKENYEYPHIKNIDKLRSYYVGDRVMVGFERNNKVMPIILWYAGEKEWNY